MKLQEKLKEVKNNKSALLATNFYNYETLKGILLAASELDLPIILQLSESSIKYLGLRVAVRMARSAIGELGVVAWLHLDHAKSIGLVRECLNEGFDSIMIDGSELDYENNIRITKEAVKLSSQFGANVEAELGYIPKLGQSQNNLIYSQPEDVKFFVEETGINALAVAIGSVHGSYKGTPNINIEKLREINEANSIPLVLHGGSGIPDFIVQKTISNGISKLNIATEIKDTFTIAIKNSLCKSLEIDLRKTFLPAIQEVKTLVENKLRLVTMKFI